MPSLPSLRSFHVFFSSRRNRLEYKARSLNFLICRRVHAGDVHKTLKGLEFVNYLDEDGSSKGSTARLKDHKRVVVSMQCIEKLCVSKPGRKFADNDLGWSDAIGFGIESLCR